ncbi:hypothetical protein DPMN_044747 [Dreissena polymorpha]|uniref:Uncharacterized protein n=1 Tax=Dreissena polymorpha TaxID=45954 RepID=A0A9D4D3R9_DREPO|nr:hypothetical protein DPMN_044747 [Dreissena polymorpha]
MFMGAALRPPPGKSSPRSAPYFLHTGDDLCPTIPVPLQTGPLAGPGQRTPDDKQRLTRPLHLGEDSNLSNVEDVRLEGDGLSWISRATRRSSPL